MKEADIPQLASVAYESRNNSPFHSQKRTAEEIGEQLARISDNDHFLVVETREESTRELVGWLILYTGLTGMIFIEPWEPNILPSENKEKILSVLISKAIRFSEEAGTRRLEVLFNNITDQNRDLFQEYFEWYESRGLAFVCEEIVMSAEMGVSSLPPMEIPTGIQLVSFNDVTNEQIEEPFFESFLDSGDLLFRSMCRENQMVSFNHWFNRKRTPNLNASRIAVRNGSVVGFCIVHPDGDQLSMGPVGVIPVERGKGLGKALVLYALQSLNKQGITNLTLSVCTENTPALALYESLGFEKSHSEIFHALNFA